MCETAQAWEPRAHIFNHHFFKFITNILFCNPSYFTFQYLQQNICLTFLLIFLLQVWTRTLWQRPPTWCPRSTASMPSSLPARENARRSSADPSRHLLSSNLPKKDAKISQKYKERPKMSTSHPKTQKLATFLRIMWQRTGNYKWTRELSESLPKPPKTWTWVKPSMWYSQNIPCYSICIIVCLFVCLFVTTSD